MLARYPLLGFGTEVLANFEDQARRKPDSAAAASVNKKDMAGRVAANPPRRPPARLTRPPGTYRDVCNGTATAARAGSGG